MLNKTENGQAETLLIAGIDPGTTIGYALLDLDGNIVEMNSSKLLDLGKVIKIVSETGLPLIVAADKSPVPKFVERVATKLGARLAYPGHNLLVAEKKELCRGFEPGDDHQRDALAAAINAYRQLRPLITKIDNYVRKNRKEGLEYGLRRLLLGHEGIPIKTAARLLEKPGKGQEPVVRKAVESKDITTEYFRLYDKFEKIKKENMMISRQRDSLLKKIDKLNEEHAVKKSTLWTNKKPGMPMVLKEQKISALQSEISRLGRKVTGMEKELEEITRLIFSIDDYRVIKILGTLGYKEYEKKARALKLKKGDVLMVKDASVLSERTIKGLKTIIDIIITERPSKLLSGFTVINPKDLNIREMNGFALVERTALDKTMDKKGMFEKIVADYKKERLG